MSCQFDNAVPWDREIGMLLVGNRIKKKSKKCFKVQEEFIAAYPLQTPTNIEIEVLWLDRRKLLPCKILKTRGKMASSPQKKALKALATT